MTPQATLIELLDRLSAQNGDAVFISAEELDQWPGEAVAALKAQKLIKRAQPGKSVVCPGCERECMMPVHTFSAAHGDAVPFVVCDKRSDINRVELSPRRLTRWKTGIVDIAGFVGGGMSVRPSGKRIENGLLEIGLVKGNKRSQMLCLRFGGELKLQTGSSAIPLADVVDYGDGRFSLDDDFVRKLVDSSTTADERYTPGSTRREMRKLTTQAMHESWQKAYRKLKNEHPKKSDRWCSMKIAKLSIAAGRSEETIRKNMKP